MAELKSPSWPLEQCDRPLRPFVCGDICKYEDAFGGVLERYWINSAGFVLTIPPDQPLAVGFSDGRLRLEAKNCQEFPADLLELELRIHSSESLSLSELHVLVMRKEFGCPSRCPNEAVLKSPIWSTWATMGKSIDKSKISKFVQQISQNSLPMSVLGIDDMWSKEYGDFLIDSEKFGEDFDYIRSLKIEYGISVILWVHPFVSRSSAAFQKDMVFEDPLDWWNGTDYLLDFRKDTVCQTFRGGLMSLANRYGVDGFKFDAGEFNYMPEKQQQMGYADFCAWKQNYIELASSFPNALEEVRISCSTQREGIFVRLMDKESTWSGSNGIKSVIPCALTVSLLGYPFILPDMIGGNGYNNIKPDKELYVRWVQMTALMPAMQFSIPPWDYDEETMELTKAALRLRERFVSVIQQLARKSVETGEPIIRPVWWLSEEEDAFLCKDQFLLGNDVVVAPVLEKGIRLRKLFLPSGTWKCEVDQFHHKGPCTFVQLVTLADLPVYTRVL